MARRAGREDGRRRSLSAQAVEHDLAEQGRAQAPCRGGRRVRRRRPALPLGPVRLLLDGRGQRPQPRQAVGQARADRRDRARGLGLAAVSAFGFCAARGRRWRAGPVAGHGLRLRKLRLRGVSRATRPNTVFARPGSTAGVAVRERDCLRDRSSCARPVCPALRPSDAAAVVCLRIGEPPGSLAVSSHDDPPPLDATARDHRCASQPTPTPAFTRRQARVISFAAVSLCHRSRRQPMAPRHARCSSSPAGISQASAATTASRRKRERGAPWRLRRRRRLDAWWGSCEFSPRFPHRSNELGQCGRVRGLSLGHRAAPLSRFVVRSDLRPRFLEGKGDRVLEAEYTALAGRGVPSIGSVAWAGRREEARVQPLLDGILWVTVAMGGRGANETRGAMVVAVDGGDRGEAL